MNENDNDILWMITYQTFILHTGNGVSSKKSFSSQPFSLLSSSSPSNCNNEKNKLCKKNFYISKKNRKKIFLL